MPIFVPLIALISCFLLSSRRDKKNFGLYKYLYFIIGFVIIVYSEITVRYSGTIRNALYSVSLPVFDSPRMVRTYGSRDSHARNTSKAKLDELR